MIISHFLDDGTTVEMLSNLPKFQQLVNSRTRILIQSCDWYAFFFNNWSVVDLQCCVSGVLQSESVTHIYVSTFFSYIDHYRVLSNRAWPVVHSF